jgi:hypothetical protein
MLDPTPKTSGRRQCPCCTNWFEPELGCAEFCSLECARTAQNSYREFGELRRCKNCRREFVGFERYERLCRECGGNATNRIHRPNTDCA